MMGAGTLPPGPILASACLLGRPCRYDGGHCAHPAVLRLARHRPIVPICPEIAGGLRTPRAPAEILGGDGRDVLAGRALVLDREGRDLTGAFLAGARAAAALAREHGARAAILKERSPSCGVRWIYDGSFSGRRMPGQGVTTAWLAEEGVRVLSEEECGEALPRGGHDEGRGKPPAP